jgi:hypothetical protein
MKVLLIIIALSSFCYSLIVSIAWGWVLDLDYQTWKLITLSVIQAIIMQIYCELSHRVRSSSQKGHTLKIEEITTENQGKDNEH